MYEYVRHKLSKLSCSTPFDKQVEAIKNLYNDLEAKGFHHAEIYTMITQVIIEQIQVAEAELKKLKE